MTVQDFITLYSEDSLIKTLAENINTKPHHCIQLKGLKGSLDAVFAASLYRINNQPGLFIMHDREEASYFLNDLQNLIPGQEVLLFPSSYKRPYQFEETENANILMRAGVLNRINQAAAKSELIVTYPEALTEKVINKRSLTENTFTARKGESVDTEFLAELLQTYDFERTDFVYEAGQFAVRGGIIDVYSYANELPYRIELFGDEIESLRTFDPVSQLSTEIVEQISIIPNVQTRLLKEERQSFLDFMPGDTKIFIKDYQHTLDIIENSYSKAGQSFDTLMKQAGDTQVVMSPETLFEQAEDFAAPDAF